MKEMAAQIKKQRQIERIINLQTQQCTYSEFKAEKGVIPAKADGPLQEPQETGN